MSKDLLAEYISDNPNAKTLLLFGGNVERRHQIITLLQPIQNLSVYGALSEDEGIEHLQALPKVDVVLIGGRYSEEQRTRIRSFIHKNYPSIKITEPGYHYPYSNAAIFENVQLLLNYL
jgi:hypothetical protein